MRVSEHWKKCDWDTGPDTWHLCLWDDALEIAAFVWETPSGRYGWQAFAIASGETKSLRTSQIAAQKAATNAMLHGLNMLGVV